MIALTWVMNPAHLIHEARVPILMASGTRGEYLIWIEPRPTYCDRGRWLVNVDARPSYALDAQEGFPRYYFGWDRMMAEVEAWVNAREECRAAAEAAAR